MKRDKGTSYHYTNGIKMCIFWNTEMSSVDQQTVNKQHDIVFDKLALRHHLHTFLSKKKKNK